MKKTALLLTMLCFTLLLVACVPNGGPNPLAGTSWKLASYGPAASPQPAALDVETSLAFAAGGKLNGNFGCNSFGGDYTVKDGQIVFGSIVTTMMACDGPRMEQEAVGFQVLKDTAGFKVEGGTLTLTSADGSAVLTFTAVAGK